MQIVFFYIKDIQKIFWKTIDFVKNLQMTQTARGESNWGHGLCVIMTQCVQKSICNSLLIYKKNYKSNFLWNNAARK